MRGTTNQLLIVGCMSGVVAILIDAIGSFPFHIAPSAVMTVVFASLIVSIQNLSSPSERELSLPSSYPLVGED